MGLGRNLYHCNGLDDEGHLEERIGRTNWLPPMSSHLIGEGLIFGVMME